MYKAMTLLAIAAILVVIAWSVVAITSANTSFNIEQILFTASLGILASIFLLYAARKAASGTETGQRIIKPSIAVFILSIIVIMRQFYTP